MDMFTDGSYNRHMESLDAGEAFEKSKEAFAGEIEGQVCPECKMAVDIQDLDLIEFIREELEYYCPCGNHFWEKTVVRGDF